MSHEDSAIPLPWVSRLAKLNGYGMDKWWGCSKRLSIVWWLTYEYKGKMRNYTNSHKLVMIKK